MKGCEDDTKERAWRYREVSKWSLNECCYRGMLTLGSARIAVTASNTKYTDLGGPVRMMKLCKYSDSW